MGQTLPSSAHWSVHWRISHMPLTFLWKQMRSPTAPRLVKFSAWRGGVVARLLDQRADQRPRAGADVGPVVAGGGNAGDGGRGVVAGGRDQRACRRRRAVPRAGRRACRRRCRAGRAWARWRGRDGGVEDFAAPLFFVELDQLRVGRVGVLGYARAAPVREQILRQVEPLLALGKSGQRVGVELVHRIQRQNLDAGKLSHPLLAALAMRGTLGLNGARIAIAERIGQRHARSIHSHVIDSPAIHSNGTNPLGREFSALAQSLFHAVYDAVEVPVQAAVDLARIVGESVHKFNCRLATLPPQQRHAAAFRPEIDWQSRLSGRWVSAVCQANSSS